jgi:hypothetical protein
MILFLPGKMPHSEPKDPEPNRIQSRIWIQDPDPKRLEMLGPDPLMNTDPQPCQYAIMNVHIRQSFHANPSMIS